MGLREERCRGLGFRVWGQGLSEEERVHGFRLQGSELTLKRGGV